LYRAFTGEPIPEQGPELAALATISTTPSSPQLLAPALAPASERIELEEFYQQLLAFKRRLTLAPLALRVASGTSIGLNQTRLTNEDACGYLTWCSAYEGRVAYNAVLCAIDGMGGMDAGEVASTSALRAVLQTASLQVTTQIVGAAGADLETEEEPALGAAVEAEPPARIDPKDLVRAAAEASYTAARGRRVGATITCAVIEDGILTLGHVGDTRAYLLRDGLLTQLTRDHSLVAAMVASGMIMAEEARGHPEQNKVLRSLGGQRTLPPEHIDGLEVAYGTPVLELRNDDQLLFCSDGVWGVLDDDALLDILTNSVDCETAVRVAIRRVLEGGAPDNAAIIVARCTVMPAS
jgi:protein phosphatase